MPKDGQKSVTLNIKIYNTLEVLARKAGMSVAGYTTELILEKTQEVPAQ